MIRNTCPNPGTPSAPPAAARPRPDAGTWAAPRLSARARTGTRARAFRGRMAADLPAERGGHRQVQRRRAWSVPLRGAQQRPTHSHLRDPGSHERHGPACSAIGPEATNWRRTLPEQLAQHDDRGLGHRIQSPPRSSGRLDPITWRVSMNTGICRVVLAWNSPTEGYAATSFGHSPARAAPSSSSASTVNVWAPTSTVVLGLALRLWYQSGWAGDPPLEATITKRPSP